MSVSDVMIFPFMCADAPATTSASVPSSKVCPKCGTNKKTGQLNCCAIGGSWFNKCGAPGDSTFKHTWSEGMRACQSLELVHAVLSHEESILPPLSNISIVAQTPTRESTDIHVPGGVSDTLRTESVDYLIAVAMSFILCLYV